MLSHVITLSYLMGNHPQMIKYNPLPNHIDNGRVTAISINMGNRLKIIKQHPLPDYAPRQWGDNYSISINMGNQPQIIK